MAKECNSQLGKS